MGAMWAGSRGEGGTATSFRVLGTCAPLRWAVSSGECNEFEESLGGSLPVEGLSGSAVEHDGDVVEVVLGESGQVGAFGHPLAEEAVGVLVAAALPGAVGVAEVDVDAGDGRELLVTGHL